MIRLNEVIKLEEKIRSLLQRAPSNYIPPICQFNCSPNKQLKQKKSVGGNYSTNNSFLHCKTSTFSDVAPSKTSKKKQPAADVNIHVESENTLFDLLHTQKSLSNAPNRFSVNVKVNFNSLSYGPKEIYR